MSVTWPGPRPYTDTLASVFRGRDKDTARALDQVRGQRLSLMTASSGAGKTSLLQAGVIPKIREFRLIERSSGRSPVAPFPLLVNEWLERAGKGESMDFSHLLVLEMHGSLRKSRDWYRVCAAGIESADAAPAELEAIEAAMKALADMAEAEGFASLTPDDGPLAWVQSSATATPREMTDRLLKAIDVLSAALGEVLLILDQFEEILLDWRLGQQAQDAVESLFRLRRTNLRQLISMRDDGVHLIKPLEKKGVLERKREFEIKPLSAAAVERILLDVGAEAGHLWDEEPLPSGAPLATTLVEAFTQTRTGGGTRAGEVNLVGLQVVLNAMFEDALAEGEPVTAGALSRYCSSLLVDDGSRPSQTLEEWLDVDNDTGLVRLAPLTWITRCLDGSLNAAGDAVDPDVFELQVQPLAARMSTQLVTPGGNKRTMTSDELHDLAYGNIADHLKKDDLAGLAAEHDWDTTDYKRVMHATADAALGRLTTGNVLKRRGSETGQDIAYELVHDQFGRPFQDWALQYKETPENDLSSLTAIRSTKFEWSGDLRPHDDDGIIPFAKWIDCTLNNVNFSDLTFVNCDFGESNFSGCMFADAVFQDCDLTNAVFKDCTFLRARFLRSALDSTRWQDGTRLEHVVIAGGETGMSFAQLTGASIVDCRFAAKPDPKETAAPNDMFPMRYIQFVDCDFSGEVTFDHCGLGGIVLRGLQTPATIGGALRFLGCAMKGAEFSSLDARGADTLQFLDCSMPGAQLSSMDIRGAALDLIDSDCRAAAFIDIDGGADEQGKVADISFSNTQLIGAAMVACTLRDVDFDATEAASATAFTIRGRAGEDGSIVAPSYLANLNFKGLELKNLTIEGCEIEGDITFDACSLVGAELIGLSNTDSPAREIGGTVLLENGCDASAMKFATLHLTPEHPLLLRDSALSGALFEDVDFEGEGLDSPAGVFTHTVMGGSSFLGCRLHGVRFEGATDQNGDPATGMPSLVILPGQDLAGVEPSIGCVAFENMFMPGLTIRDVPITDDVRFVNCDLGGSGIVASVTDDLLRLPVDGELAFAGCVMDAFEFSRLRFSERPLRMVDCDCNGALLRGIVFPETSGGDGNWLVSNSDLRGALLLDCQATGVRLSGMSASGRSSALSLAVRGTGESPVSPAFIGDWLVEGYDLDGAVFEGLDASGVIAFKDCSLLRSKFARLELAEAARVDVRQSDVLYAEVDLGLADDTNRFLLTEDQRQALSDQAKHEDILRIAREHPREPV